MYAIVETGGKQYRVAPNDKITVEKLPGKAGDSLSLDRVLLVADGDKISIGKPTVPGAAVKATLLAQRRGTQTRVVKYKKRTGEHNRKGHRQQLSILRIEGISLA
jgi:large subunit ribosomal protein L21